MSHGLPISYQKMVILRLVMFVFSGVKIFLLGVPASGRRGWAGLRCTAGPTARGSWRHKLPGAALMYLSSLAFLGVFQG